MRPADTPEQRGSHAHPGSPGPQQCQRRGRLSRGSAHLRLSSLPPGGGGSSMSPAALQTWRLAWLLRSCARESKERGAPLWAHSSWTRGQRATGSRPAWRLPSSLSDPQQGRPRGTCVRGVLLSPRAGAGTAAAGQGGAEAEGSQRGHRAVQLALTQNSAGWEP